MTAFLLFIWLLCLAGVLHTYLIYPWLMLRWARSQDAGPDGLAKQDAESRAAALPAVYVLMAAHNEEAVLPLKLASLTAQDYAGPLRFLVGSDNSSDATNDMLAAAAREDERLIATYFRSRQGKPSIINQLAERALTLNWARRGNPNRAIFIITDASVILRPDVISQLVMPMHIDSRIGVVDATMVQTGAVAEGIGQAETLYINREVRLKRAEGVRWGAMVGPFGGCWAVRADAFTPIPDNFLVDDFFLCMAAYEKGYLGISSPTAIVEEGVGQRIDEEFRRKVRISSGNWQNLVHFRKLWWPFWQSPLAYAVFSHKILRWLTPMLLLIGAICLGGLRWYYRGAGNLLFPRLFELSVIAVVGLPLLDVILSRIGVHLRLLRNARYFLAMNVALLVGFWRYLTGITSNVWQPSKRH